MKQFQYKFYIRTNNQEFNVGIKNIEAIDIDCANKKLNKLELPYHHYSTVEQTKNTKL
jgi:hypothetical protein